MTGIQNIFTNRAFTLEELIQFMRQNWDTEQYNDFIIDRPTPLSAVKGILLPATPETIATDGDGSSGPTADRPAVNAADRITGREGTELEAQACVGQNAVVVGGANSAGQAALHLAEHGARVAMIVRAESLRRGMSAYLAELERAGLVRSTRVGKWTHYKRDDQRIAGLVAELGQTL